MTSLGELVKKWRVDSGLTWTALARLVAKGAATDEGKNVKRQHIQQLEKAGDRQPRYLKDLATAMGTTADNLLALRMPPLHSALPRITQAPHPAIEASPPPPAPPSRFKDRHWVDDSDWALLEAVRIMMPQAEKEDIVARYAAAMTRMRQDLGEINYKIETKGKPE